MMYSLPLIVTLRVVSLQRIYPAVRDTSLRVIADHDVGPHGLLATKTRVLDTSMIAFTRQFDQLAFVRCGIILILNAYGRFSKLVYVL